MMFRVGLVVLCLSAAVGCALEAPDTGPTTGPAAVEEIQAASNLYSGAFLAGDADSIANLSTIDVIASPIDLDDIEGRDSVRSFFRQAFVSMTVFVYRFSVIEAEIYGDVCYDRGTYVWESVWGDQPNTRTSGRYSAVRRRGNDGVWRVHRIIENADRGAE